MGSVRLGLVTVCHSLSEFFCLVTIVNMVVVKVQGGKKVTGPVASSLPVTVRDTARDRQREVVAARLVQTHSMVAATVMLLVMSLTLLSLANFRDVGRENLCLRAQIAALQREKAMLECTARKFMRREQLARAASFRETQLNVFIPGPAVPEVTVWYRVPMALFFVSPPESAKEESKEELVTKLEKEVYEPEMEEDEMEDEEMEASMEETIVEKEEMVEKEMRDNTGEDEIINAP